jgi:hypothetical protein
LPVEVGYFVTSFPVRNVAVAGQIIVVGSSDGGLFVLANNTLTEVAREEPSSYVAGEFRLGQNYPNPFNPSAGICFNLAQDGRVSLAIYTVDGRRVATLVDAGLPPGDHEFTWNGCDSQNRVMPSGIYFYRLTAGEFVETRRMTLIR